MAATAPIGRAGEVAAVGGFLESGPAPGAVALDGPVGIGKTTIWEAALEVAAARGQRVLAARASPTEAPLSFAALGDLLGGVADEVDARLSDPQREALDAALLRASSPPDRIDARAVGMATLEALRLASQAAPLVLALDDLQWVDPPSAAALAFALRRLQDAPVRVVATLRADPGYEESQVTRSLGRNRVLRIPVGPLEPDTLHAIATALLGQALPGHVLRRLVDSADGNPLFALELARDLLARGGSLPPGELPPVPGGLRGLIAGRLEGLPLATRSAIEAVAALGRPTLGLIAEVTGDTDALDPAFSAGILTIEGGQIRFTHPLLAAAVREDVAPGSRLALHARLADVVTDPEDAARHLAMATISQSASVAATVEEGGRLAAARGAPDSAAELLAHSLRLTPDEDEADIGRRVAMTVRHLCKAGDSSQAAAVGREALEVLDRGPAWAQAALALVETEALPIDETVELAEAAVAERPGDPKALLALVNAHMNNGDHRAAMARAHQALPLTAAASRELRVSALTVAGELEVLLGDPGGWRLLEEAVALEGDEIIPDAYLSPVARLGCARIWSDDVDAAAALLTRRCADAKAAGDDFARVGLCMHLAELAIERGELGQAELHAREGLALAEQSGADRAVGIMLYTQAHIHALRGEADAAVTTAKRGLELVAGVADALHTMPHRWVLGLLALGTEDAATACRELVATEEALAATGICEPGFLPVQPDAIEARIMAGELETAEAALDAYERLGQRLGRARVHTTAARCRALLAAARGDLDAAEASLKQALIAHAGLSIPIEHGRTLLAFGAVLRRLKRKAAARDALTEACEILERAGATLWAERARAELSRIGGRDRTGVELTATESRVAAVVAEGRSNREAAAALFLSPKTVEFHLRNIFRKLGVKSRAELARRVPAETNVARRG